MGGVYALDCETNDVVLPSVVHCVSMINARTGEAFNFADQPGYYTLADFAEVVDDADEIIGHNIVSYDAPVLRRLLGVKLDKRRLRDTLHATRILWPDLRAYDQRKQELPLKNYGSHSLYAWGVRVGIHKGDFGEKTDWSEWSPEMMAYCEQDVRVTLALYSMIRERDHD